MFGLHKVFLKKNIIEKNGENFPNNDVWFTAHQLQRKRKSHLRFTDGFIPLPLNLRGR